MARKSVSPLQTATFIESMECLPVTKIPEGPEWTYEIKLDGYRLEVVRTGGETTLYSRRRNVLNRKFHYIAKALDYLPADTVLDGELVALGPDGKPMSRCTQFPESRFFVFNPFPGFEYMVVALKPRNFALKPRTKFRLKFVRDLNAKTNPSRFLAEILIRDLSAKHTVDSGI